jgi:hypothetical protein
MPISFFRTLNSVLTQAIANICRVYRIDESDAVSQARQYLIENSAAYYSDTPDLRYDEPLCRIVYLYAYVGAHANLVDNAFYKYQELHNLVMNRLQNDGTLHVCSLGGGPGSELLGFVKFIERERGTNDRVDISFSLIDNVTHWDETWHALINGLENTFEASYGSSRRNWPIVVHRSFLPLDLTRIDEFQHFPARFNEVQIYVLNHTVSELICHSDEFKEVFDAIVERAAEEALFLFIDRNQGEVRDLIDELITTNGLAALGTYQEQTNMDIDEQKTDLGKWYYLMERDPKLTWNAFFALAQKPISIPF